MMIRYDERFSEVDERNILRKAIAAIGLSASGARLVSNSSRCIWKLPNHGIALAITQPDAQTYGEIIGEANAVRAAIAAGVSTPPVLVNPIALPEGRFAIGYRWVDGQPNTQSGKWPQIVAEAVKLSQADGVGLQPVNMALKIPQTILTEVLGTSLAATFMGLWDEAAKRFTELLRAGQELVLAHGDLHPANVLTDEEGKSWLIDFEHAGQAPAEWDPAKILILSRRFGEPSDSGQLLASWPQLDTDRLAVCVFAQEVQIVGWLVQMAARGRVGAAEEAQRRTSGLMGDGPRWRHL